MISLAPRDYHLMLVRLAKEYFPWGWSHEVTEWYDACGSLSKIKQVIVNEFAPRYWAGSIKLDYAFLRMAPSPAAVLDLVRFEHEMAFAGLAEVIVRTYNLEVIPADIPAGE